MPLLMSKNNNLMATLVDEVVYDSVLPISMINSIEKSSVDNYYRSIFFFFTLKVASTHATVS